MKAPLQGAVSLQILFENNKFLRNDACAFLSKKGSGYKHIVYFSFLARSRASFIFSLIFSLIFINIII